MRTSLKFGRVLTAVMTGLMLTGAQAQEQDVKKMVVDVCSNCHGVDGNATSPIFPKLAGQHKEYLLAQLKAFHDRTRKEADAHAYMWGLTRMLDNAMMEKLAAYFAAQKPTHGTAGDPQLAAKGRQIFENGIDGEQVPPCAQCHGKDAQGNQIFPRLAGQHHDYLVKQIRVFHSDDRPNNAVMMQAVVKGLTDQEADAVATYLQGL